MCVKTALFCIERTLTSVYQKKNVVSAAGQSDFADMLILTAAQCKWCLSSASVLSKCESGTAPFSRASLYLKLQRSVLSAHLDSRPSADVLLLGKNYAPGVACAGSLPCTQYLFSTIAKLLFIWGFKVIIFSWIPWSQCSTALLFYAIFYAIHSCLQEICTLHLLKGYNVFCLSMYR